MSGPSTLLPFQPATMSTAQLAAVSYLARYSGRTHALYASHLPPGDAGRLLNESRDFLVADVTPWQCGPKGAPRGVVVKRGGASRVWEWRRRPRRPSVTRRLVPGEVGMRQPSSPRGGTVDLSYQIGRPRSM